MRISPVRTVNVNPSLNNNPNFKGLWGKIDGDSTDGGGAEFMETYTYKHYHPFLDETKEEIRKVADDNYYCSGWVFPAPASYAKKDTVSIYVEEPLNVTKEEYKTFLSDPDKVSDRVYGVISRFKDEHGGKLKDSDSYKDSDS